MRTESAAVGLRGSHWTANVRRWPRSVAGGHHHDTRSPGEVLRVQRRGCRNRAAPATRVRSACVVAGFETSFRSGPRAGPGAQRPTIDPVLTALVTVDGGHDDRKDPSGSAGDGFKLSLHLPELARTTQQTLMSRPVGHD